MPLTPNDVANKQFGRAVRGYSVEEVDDFLDEVENELVRLLNENGMLSQRLSNATPTPTAAAATPAAPVEAEARDTQQAALRTLLMAQRTADQAVAEARAEADKLLADTKEKVARSEQELNARVAATMASIEAERSAAERRVEELKAFEREYRVRLKAYLEGQLRDLEQRAAPEGQGAGVPAAARSAAIGTMPPGVADARAAAPPAAPAPTAAPPAAPPAAPAPVPAPPAAPTPVPAPPVPAPPVPAPPVPAPPVPAPPVAPPAAPPSGPPREAGVGPFTMPPPRPYEQEQHGQEPPSAQ